MKNLRKDIVEVGTVVDHFFMKRNFLVETVLVLLSTKTHNKIILKQHQKSEQWKNQLILNCLLFNTLIILFISYSLWSNSIQYRQKEGQPALQKKQIPLRTMEGTRKTSHLSHSMISLLLKFTTRSKTRLYKFLWPLPSNSWPTNNYPKRWADPKPHFSAMGRWKAEVVSLNGGN